MQIHTYQAYYTQFCTLLFFSHLTIWSWKWSHIGMYRTALLISKAAQYSILWLRHNLLYKSFCWRTFSLFLSFFRHTFPCTYVFVHLHVSVWFFFFLECNSWSDGIRILKFGKYHHISPFSNLQCHLAKPVLSKVDLWQSVRQNMYLLEWVSSLAFPSLWTVCSC